MGDKRIATVLPPEYQKCSLNKLNVTTAHLQDVFYYQERCANQTRTFAFLVSRQMHHKSHHESKNTLKLANQA